MHVSAPSSASSVHWPRTFSRAVRVLHPLLSHRPVLRRSCSAPSELDHPHTLVYTYGSLQHHHQPHEKHVACEVVKLELLRSETQLDGSESSDERYLSLVCKPPPAASLDRCIPARAHANQEYEPLAQHPPLAEHHVGNSSFCQSIFNTANVLLGVGTLSLPYSLRLAGWSGLCVLLFAGYVTNYTSKLLARCQAKLHVPSYPDIAYHAWGPSGKLFLALCLYLELFSYMCVFLVLSGYNLHQISIGSAMGLNISQQSWTILTFVATLPICLIRELRIMSYVSLIGTTCSLLLTFLVLLFSCADLWEVVHDPIPPSAGADVVLQHQFFDGWGMAMAFGLVMCAFAGHAVVPSLYEAMRERNRFDSMIDTTYIMCMTCYVAVAAMGYLTYGQQTQEQVTMNMQGGLFATCVCGLIVCMSYSKFCLIQCPVAEGILEVLDWDSQTHEKITYKPGTFCSWARSACVRAALSVSALGVALSVPSFGYLCALIGSVVSVLISVTLPCLLYLEVFRDTLHAPERWCLWVLSVFGCLCGAFGLTATLSGVGVA